MKKIRSLLCSQIAGLLLVPVIGGVVLAASTTNSSSGPLITPTDPEQSTSMPQRIIQRKSALNVQLSSGQSQNIADKCSVAQTGLQQVGTKDKTAIQTRTQIYDDLAAALARIVDNLQHQNIDTVALQAAQAQFYNAIDKYLTDSIVYKTAMDDAVVMDCTSDPTGFEVTLQSARALRAQMASDSSQINAALPNLTQALMSDKTAIAKIKGRQ